MKRILVTGGAGYIGSHASKALPEAGFMPVCFDNLSTGHACAVKRGPLVEGDLLDPEAIDQVIAEVRPAGLIHFAAYLYVGESVAEPRVYFRNNFSGTLNLLDSMRRHAVDHLVFCNTCATYSAPEKLPLTEDHPQRPINPYGASKLRVERVLADCFAAHGLHAVSLRYFNAAGADEAGEIGEQHEPQSYLIPMGLAAAKSGLPVTKYGDDYDTSDGTCIRDYIHVSDLAHAHVLAWRSLLERAKSASYSLGNGCGYSVREVISAAERVTGVPIASRVGVRREGDPPVLVGDAATFINDLQWRSQHPNIGTIIDSAWRSHRTDRA